MAGTQTNRSSRNGTSPQFTTAVDLETGHRLQPQNLEAEKAVLGAMMLSADAVGDVTDILIATDFYASANEIIFSAITSLLLEGKPIDQISVINELGTTGKLQNIGGEETVLEIIDSVQSVANVEYYAQIVKNMSLLRRVIAAGTRIEQIGYTTEGADANEAINIAEREVFNLSEKSSATDYHSVRELLPSAQEAIESAKARGGEIHGVATGIPDLDDVLHGLKAGQMIIIAARPGVGKSTLANKIALSASFDQKMTTAIFNLEMASTEIMMRFISARLTIDHGNLLRGKITADEMQRIQAFQKTLETGGKDGGEVNLIIDDSPNMTMTQIRTKCRRIKKASGLNLIIVDYLNLMRGEGRIESRQQEVADISRRLKLLAKELEVPIIAITQINRQAEISVGGKSVDNRPKLIHLRESGAIEQDADVVLLIHQEMEKVDDENGQKVDKKADLAEIIIAKNRAGRNGVTIEVVPQLQFCRFEAVKKSMHFAPADAPEPPADYDAYSADPTF